MNWKRVLLVSTVMAGLLLLPAPGYGQTSYTVSFPHIAYGYANATDYWETHYIIWNTGSTSATVILHHYKDDGSPLTLSIDGNSATTHTFTIPANASIDKQIDVAGQNTVVSAWSAAEVSGSVKGQVIFKQHTTNAKDGTRRAPEATVPMNNSSPPLCIIPFPQQSTQISIPFDNTGSNADNTKVNSGMAVANTTNAPVTYNLTYINQAGTQLCATTLNVPAFGHTAIIITSGAGSCAASDNQKGTIVLSGAGLSAVGLRFNFNTSEFTTSLQ